MDTDVDDGKTLGQFLKSRRERMSPGALGLNAARRRTPGLRREEVAQRANISVTWYTWLEQGRGGAPSSEVLERVCRALLLTQVEREHAFLLAYGSLASTERGDEIDQLPSIQRILDALAASPAFVKTSAWDLVAWNRAAGAVFGYDNVGHTERNILRRIFLDPESRLAQLDWEAVARFAVAVFRADMSRAVDTGAAHKLAVELRSSSPDFDRLWQANDVQVFGQGVKHLRHPTAGMIVMEYASFTLDGRPDLSMVVYSPRTPQHAIAIARLMAEPK